MDRILPLKADYHPVLGQLMNEMDLADVINRVMDIPGSQANIDVGTFVCLFIHHILGDVNVKMYRMDEFFTDKAMPLLIPWKPDIDISEINDDRAARVLDSIWKVNPQKVFSAVVDAVIPLHSLETNSIHADTTSKSFYGAYDKSIDAVDVPNIIYGYSKDHRHDLKQIIFGIGTTSDGVPIVGEVASGNESDMTLNGRWIKKLRKLLKKDKEDFLLYIGDSALVTTDNLDHLADEHMDFISRLPGRFDIEEELKKKANLENDWEDIGKISEEKNAASYKVWDTTGDIEGRMYRFIAVYSDHKDKRKIKALDKAVNNECNRNMKRFEKLSKRPFACKKDAEIEAKNFQKKHSPKFHQIDWTIEVKEEKMKRKKRGRPKKNETIRFQTNYYLSGSLSLDDDAYETERELCGQYVLITSLKDTEKEPAKTILEKYKGQYYVERIFKFVKNPSWVGSFCLNKPERVAALGYILFMAAIIYTLWERRVRMALDNEDTEPIDGLNRQKTKRPTAYALEVVLNPILVLSQQTGEKLRIWLPKPLSRNIQRVIELSGFDVDIYQGEWVVG
jgi:transposase